MPESISVTDGLIRLRAPRPHDPERLCGTNGRSSDRVELVGAASPAAWIIAHDEIAGWVDFDADPAWLQAGEVQVRYGVNAPGCDDQPIRGAQTAHIIVDAQNTASLRVARAVAATESERWVTEHGRTMIRYILALR